MIQTRLAKVIPLVLALLPLLLLAYMGQFSRIMYDDYAYLLVGSELGPWDAMLHWRDTWNGGYTDQLLHGVFAPLRAAAPRILPSLLLSSWLLALTLLFRSSLRRLHVKRHRNTIAIVAAALTVVAAVNAFYTKQTFYWYTAVVAYSLAPAALILFLVFLLESASASRHEARLLPGAVAGFAFSFMAAGISSMYMVVQGGALAILLMPVALFARRTGRRAPLTLVAAGLAATAVSFVVQITAPGVAFRSTRISPIESVSKRALPDWLQYTAEATYYIAGQETIFAGFILLFGFGLFAALLLHGSPRAARLRRPAVLARAPLCCGLIVQLASLPLLWMHTSDLPSVFGRFSYAYASVVALNLGLLFIFAMLLWRRRRFGDQLVGNRDRLFMLSAGVLLMVVIMFAGAHFRSVHHRAARYLFATATLLLTLLAWQLAQSLADERANRYGQAALLFGAACAFSYLLMVGIPMYMLGKANSRIVVPSILMHVLLGLIMGGYLGYLIRRISADTPARQTWLRRIGLVGLATALIVTVGICLGQARFIPDLQTFAREWDERERMIISQRDSGQLDVVVAPLTFDLTWHLMFQRMSKGESGGASQYYGVDSISVTEADA